MSAELGELVSSSEYGDVIDVAIAATEPKPVDIEQRLFSIVVPRGAEHVLVDTEDYGPAPARKKGTVRLSDAASLVRYVERHHHADRTVLYADVVALAVVGVLNDDGTTPEDAAWADHRAVLRMTKTAAWERWESRDGEYGNQVAFAEHIEESLPDIRVPSGAEMLELAQSFQAHTKVRFESGQHLSSGQRQLIYVEDTTATAGAKGNITIPSEFTLGLAPFEGSDMYEVTARLRYRIGNGTLTIGYALDRPEDVLRAAFDDALRSISDALSTAGLETPLLRGTPR